MDSPLSMLLFVLCAWLVDAEILDSITSKPVEPWYPREFVFAPVEVISTPVYDRNSEQEEHILSLKRTDMFIGRRRRRAVKEPSPNALDDQAAAAIFGDEGKWDHKPKHRESPPAPPDPVLYNRQFPVKPSGIQRESQHGSREYDSLSSSNAHLKAPSGSDHSVPLGIGQGPSSSKMAEKIQQRSESKAKDPSSSSTTTDPKIPLGIEKGRSDADMQDKIDQRPKSSNQNEAKQESSNSSGFETEREMPLSKIQEQAEHEIDHKVSDVPVGIAEGPSIPEMEKKIEEKKKTEEEPSTSANEDHKATSDPKIPLGIEQGLSDSKLQSKIDQRPTPDSPSEETSPIKQPESEKASSQQGPSSSDLEDKLPPRPLPLPPSPSGELSSPIKQLKIEAEPVPSSPPLDQERTSSTLQLKLRQKPSPITPSEELSSAQLPQQVQISITHPGNGRRPSSLRNKQPQHSYRTDTDEEERRPYRPSMSRTPLKTILVEEIQRGPAFFSPQTRYLPLATVVVPYDSHVDPDFPLEAPRARGLVDEGSSSVDNDFRTGYRYRALPASARHRTYEIDARGRERAGYIYDAPLHNGAEPLFYGGRSTNNHYVVSSPGRYTYEVAPPAYIIG